MIYLLVVFAKSDKQEEFVEFVAEEISTVSNPDFIKYYFGEESIIFTFESFNDYEILSKFVSDVFLGMDIVFFLTQYDPNKMLEIDDNDEALIKKDKKLTLNQLLDKINEVGLENMSEKELSLLNYYSNQF